MHPIQGLGEPATLTSLLETCRTIRDLEKLHTHVIKHGLTNHIPVATKMLSFCAATSPDSGNLEYARQIFRQLNRHNSFLYNSLIRAHSGGDSPEHALLLFQQMLVQATVPPDKFTFPFALKACSRLESIQEGEQIHTQVLKSCATIASDPIVENALIHMYAQCGRLCCACQLFDRNPQREDPVSWNSLIGGYMKWGWHDEALRLFELMPHRTAFSWNLMIAGFARSGKFEFAKSLMHSKGGNDGGDLIYMTCLLTMYVGSGDLRSARQLFDEMPERDLVCWSAMISGYIQCGCYKEALDLFREMQVAGVEPDKVTMVSVVSACSHLGALDQGKWIHAFILRRKKMELEGSLACAMSDMYLKCGCVDEARKVFEEMPVRDLFAWNSIICGLGTNGRGKDAVSYFKEMVESGWKPDGVTFVGLLSGCSHAGLLDEGRRCFQLMTAMYGIEPDVKHYGCLVDLFGRAGLLNEAEELVRSMHVKPSVEVWGALLGACRRHGNVEMAERAAKALIKLEPHHNSCHVLLSNVYAAAGRWGDVRAVREKIKKNKGGMIMKRVPGCSLVQVRGVISEFVVGDVSHPRSEEIYSMLGEISQHMKLVRYVPDTSQALFDGSEEEKEASLGYHSEKLALAFGLIGTGRGETIRIVKNLRVCWDCHSTIKLVSLIYGREIILRDRNRFHLFKQGSCSCEDYW